MTLSLITKVLSTQARAIQDAIFDGEKLFYQKLAVAGHDDSLDDILLEFVPLLFESDSRVEQSRTKAAEAALAMAACARKESRLGTLLAGEVEVAIAKERAHSVLQVLKRAKLDLGGR